MAPHRKTSVQDLVSGALAKKKKRGKASTSDVAPKKSRASDPRGREYVRMPLSRGTCIEEERVSPVIHVQGSEKTLHDEPFFTDERLVGDELGVQQPHLNSVAMTGVTGVVAEPRRWVPDLNLTCEDSIFEGSHAGKTAMECMKVFHLPGNRRRRPVHMGPDKMAEATARSLAQACNQFHDAAGYFLAQVRDHQRLKESFGKNLRYVEELRTSITEYRVVIARLSHDVRDVTLKSVEERRVLEARVMKMGEDLEAMKKDVEKLGPLTDKYDRSLKKVKQLRMRAKRLKELGSLTAGFVYREILGKLRDSGIDHRPFLPDPEEDFLEIPLVEPPPDDEETIQLSDAGESESDEEEEDDEGDDGGEGGGDRPTDPVI